MGETSCMLAAGSPTRAVLLATHQLPITGRYEDKPRKFALKSHHTVDFTLEPHPRMLIFAHFGPSGQKKQPKKSDLRNEQFADIRQCLGHRREAGKGNEGSPESSGWGRADGRRKGFSCCSHSACTANYQPKKARLRISAHHNSWAGICLSF